VILQRARNLQRSPQHKPTSRVGWHKIEVSGAILLDVHDGDADDVEIVDYH